MCIVNNILYAILYDMSTVNSCIVYTILSAILYDLVILALRPIFNTDNEMNNHGDSRALRRIKIFPCIRNSFLSKSASNQYMVIQKSRHTVNSCIVSMICIVNICIVNNILYAILYIRQ